MAGSVVVVDDEAFVAAVRPLLGEVAGSVTYLRDGSHAVATVGRERPNSVLLGLNMPGVDGHEVYRLPAAHSATARTPVVVLTALDAAATSPSRCPAATSSTRAAATTR
ncbi:response regulator [Streptomyces sp. NPDC006658]|uniref:response regulator n=1 Tax=Streptomyces sp. NPDC006658 TaxID=3156900 RepID=UPI0033D3745D